jgi:hypothetical protein
MREKRKRTQNKVWAETEAIIKYRDLLDLSSNTFETFKGNIDNIGSEGMFIKLPVDLSIGSKLEILIDFDPGGASDISLKAEGTVLRYEPEGFAVRFTQIDSQELGDCIFKKMDICNVGDESNYRCA